MEPASILIRKPKKFYSPLRYPGGKAILSQFLFNVIDTNGITNCTYAEPFAGGAGAALTLLFLEKVERILINDLDESIYAFWKSTLSHTEAFLEKLRNVVVSIDEWHVQRDVYLNPNSSEFDRGFATFFLNRTNRSGIIGGRPIGGLDQTGKWKIDARFNKKTLVERIQKISLYKNRIDLSCTDGIHLMNQIHDMPNILVYIDPPYYEKGSSLYLNHYEQADHALLANFLNDHPNFFWLLTYDNVPEIASLYPDRVQLNFELNYHTQKPKKGKEILITSDAIVI